MASTPQPLSIPFREELREPMGSEFDNITTNINLNFVSPGAQQLTLKYSDYLPDPLRGELQSLVPQINIAFGQIAAHTIATAVALHRVEELRDPYVKSLQFLVSSLNVGLAALFP